MSPSGSTSGSATSQRPQAGGKPPVFLERRTYRQRRYRDLARVLPVIGGVLVALPLLWPREGEEVARTSVALIYLFVLWAALILAAAALSTRVQRADDDLGPEV